MMFSPAVVTTGGPSIHDGGVDPTKIPGLVGWWDARYLNLNDGDPVLSWPDLSGNGFTLSQGTTSKAPKFFASGLAGVPAARFDGVDDFLGVLAYGTALLSDTITVVADFQNAVAPAGVDMVAFISPNEAPWNEWSLQTTQWNAAVTRCYDTASTGVTAVVSSPTTARQVAAGRIESSPSGVQLDCTVDGQRTAKSLANPIYRSSTNNDKFRLGNNSGPLDGDLCWVAVYDRWLSDAELAYLGVQVP